eukprot:6632060-Prymnesium_polylepis.1
MSSALRRIVVLCAGHEQHGRCTPSALCAAVPARLLSQPTVLTKCRRGFSAAHPPITESLPASPPASPPASRKVSITEWWVGLWNSSAILTHSVSLYTSACLRQRRKTVRHCRVARAALRRRVLPPSGCPPVSPRILP